MKTMQCYDCEKTFEANTSDEMLQYFYAHYMAEHHEIITGADPSEKKTWMERYHQDWAAA